MEKRGYDAGDVILSEGDPSDFAFQIMSGEVEVFKEIDGQAVMLGTVKAGEFLGEMGIIEDQPRSASARAKNHVTAVLLERDEFLRLMSEDSSSAHRLIARLCERLRIADRKLAEATVSRDVIDAPIVASRKPAAQAEINSRSTDLRLKLLPTSALLTSYLPKEGLLVSRLPFSVGRSPIGNEPKPTVPIDLSLADSRPFRLSRQHFSLSQHLERYVVLDLGSTLGTEANGAFLGYQFEKDLQYLEVGENSITAGGVGSPFTFKVLLEQA